MSAIGWFFIIIFIIILLCLFVVSGIVISGEIELGGEEELEDEEEDLQGPYVPDVEEPYVPDEEIEVPDPDEEPIYTPVPEDQYPDIYYDETAGATIGTYDNPLVSAITLNLDNAKVGDVIMVTGNYMRYQESLGFLFTHSSSGLTRTATLKSYDFYKLIAYIIVPNVENGNYQVTINNGDGNAGFPPATINVVTTYTNTNTPMVQYIGAIHDYAYTGSASLYQTRAFRGDLLMIGGNRLFGNMTQYQFVDDHDGTKIVAQVRSRDYTGSSHFLYVPNNLNLGFYYIEPVLYHRPESFIPQRIEIVR